jgi:enamine deaminase RidA (YjgF/YER057c/UK114 family)
VFSWHLLFVVSRRRQKVVPASALTVQLEAAGATWDDVVFRRIYALDVDAFLKAQADTTIPTPWSPGCAPPSTLIGVTRLSSPDFVLEVDLTAIVGA